MFVDKYRAGILRVIIALAGAAELSPRLSLRRAKTAPAEPTVAKSLDLGSRLDG
jgi:hypothetical protein